MGAPHQTEQRHQFFFRKRRFSRGDMCGVQPSECRVLAIPNGPTQHGENGLNVISTCGYSLSTPDAQNSVGRCASPRKDL